MTDQPRPIGPPPRGLQVALCPPCGRRRVVRWFVAERRLVYRRHGCENDNRPIPIGIRVEPIEARRA